MGECDDKSRAEICNHAYAFPPISYVHLTSFNYPYDVNIHTRMLFIVCEHILLGALTAPSSRIFCPYLVVLAFPSVISLFLLLFPPPSRPAPA